MTQSPRSLAEPVSATSAAEHLLEATLPAAAAHGEGNLQRALELLQACPEAATADICVASGCGKIEAVRKLLSASPALANQRGGARHWEPLLYLCFSRFLRLDLERSETMLATARLLIEAGADPNDGETAYHMVEHRGVPCAPILFPHLDEQSRGIALAHQIDYDDLDGLRTLLALGADPEGPNPFRNQPLHQAVWRGRGKETFDLLLTHGAAVDRPNSEGKTAYTMAARAGRRDIMEWLLQAGASPAIPQQDAFVAACALGDRAGAEALLQAHPALTSKLGDTERAAICDAADAGNGEGIRTMLQMGWDANTRGLVWSETPTHRAAMQGHDDTVRLLLEHGADSTIRDHSYHSSPLGWALHGGQASTVEILRQEPQRLDLRDALEQGLAARALELLGNSDVNAAVLGGDPGVLLLAAGETA